MRVIVLVVALALCACAQVPTDPEARAEFEEVNDPVEPANRAVFDFNMALDRTVLKPVARGYRAAVPEVAREKIHNAILNLRAPFTFANDVLQGEPDRAAQTLIRFMINSTAGLFGLFDVVGDTGGPKHHDEDLGQTLAVWGVGEGPYLMLPVLGPSNPRDAVGKGAEFVADPADIALGNRFSDSAVWGRTGGDLLDTRTDLLDPLDDLERNSLDFYAAIRSLYRQRRANLIANRDKPLAESVSPGP